MPHSNATHRSTLETLTIRLLPGEDLGEKLAALVGQQAIEAGIVLTCVGSLTDVSLRLANQEQGVNWQGHFEIVSLVGTLSVHGNHLHLSVADSTGRTIGGHLLTGNKIYTTAELVIGWLPDLIYTREPQPPFGYRELVVKRRSDGEDHPGQEAPL